MNLIIKNRPSMIVKKLTWLSEEAKEAELLVSDGNYECIVFSQPCDFNVGDEINVPLLAFITNNLMESDQQDYSIQITAPGLLSHECVAKVIDLENNLVKVGDIFIVLDEKIPTGCSVDSFVEFTCERFDL